MKNRERSVVVLTDLDPRLDEMRPQGTRWNLKFQSIERHAIVVADLPLFLNAEDFPEIHARDGHKRAAFLFGLDGEARVMRRDIHIAQKRVGGLHCGDICQGQFFRQPILQCVEKPFRTTSRLWRIGRDMFDPQMIQGAPNLGQVCPVNLVAGLRRVEIMAAAVCVEAEWQAVSSKHFVQRLKCRIDGARRIIHRDDEIECRLALEPCVPRAILMQHHAGQRPPWTLAPVCAAFGRLYQ